MSKEILEANGLHKGQKVLHAVDYGMPSIEVREICDAEMLTDTNFPDGDVQFLAIYCYEYDADGNKVEGTGYYERSELLTLDDCEAWLSEDD